MEAAIGKFDPAQPRGERQRAPASAQPNCRIQIKLSRAAQRIGGEGAHFINRAARIFGVIERIGNPQQLAAHADFRAFAAAILHPKIKPQRGRAQPGAQASRGEPAIAPRARNPGLVKARTNRGGESARNSIANLGRTAPCAKILAGDELRTAHTQQINIALRDARAVEKLPRLEPSIAHADAAHHLAALALRTIKHQPEHIETKIDGCLQELILAVDRAAGRSDQRVVAVKLNLIPGGQIAA